MPAEVTSVETPQLPSAMRQCPFCGKTLSRERTHCPHCREAVPGAAAQLSKLPVNQSGNIRRGLLYMLLGSVIYYFAGGYSPLNLPFPVVSAVASYLSPVVILGGLGLMLYGLYRQYAT